MGYIKLSRQRLKLPLTLSRRPPLAERPGPAQGIASLYPCLPSFLFLSPALSSIHAPRPQTGALWLPRHLAITFNLELTRVSPELEV